MNELLTKKLNSLLNLDKPKKTIGIWNIRELCNKIQAESQVEQYDLKFDFTYLYHYLGLKIVNEYDDNRDILLEGYELLKVTYYSEQYDGAHTYAGTIGGIRCYVFKNCRSKDVAER